MCRLSTVLPCLHMLAGIVSRPILRYVASFCAHRSLRCRAQFVLAGLVQRPMVQASLSALFDSLMSLWLCRGQVFTISTSTPLVVGGWRGREGRGGWGREGRWAISEIVHMSFCFHYPLIPLLHDPITKSSRHSIVKLFQFSVVMILVLLNEYRVF